MTHQTDVAAPKKRSPWLRLAPLIVLILALGAALASGAASVLSLENLLASRESMSSLIERNLPLAIGQVRMALETPGVHTVDRARFRSRLDQLIEYLPEEERDLATASGRR